MNLSIKAKNKILVLIFTIMPGANRVITFFLLSIIYNVDIFSNFSASYSFSIIISMIGGVGIGTSILKHGITLDHLSLLNAVCIGLLISIPAITLIYFLFQFQFTFISMLICGAGFTANQIFRHQVLVNKDFLLGSISELILLTPLIFLPLFKTDPLFFIGIFYIFTFTVLSYSKSEKKEIYNRYTIKESIIIGYSNLISTGILFFLPIICNEMTTDDIAALIGLLITVAGIVTVFPRAIVSYHIKDIQLVFLEKKELEYFKRTKELKTNIINIMLIGFIIMFSYTAFISRQIIIYDVLIINIAIASFLFLGQYSIIETTLINLIGKEKISIALNVFCFLIFGVSYFIVVNLQPLNSI
nr:hypothetical protein [Providencia rettgeri]